MKTFIPILFTLFVSSCSVQFTSTLRKQLENSNVEIRNIQFYNSRTFALQRELSSQETGIVGGKIKIKQGKKVEIIKIPSRTPAVVDSIDKETLFIIYEQGRNKRIPFVCDSYNNIYSLNTPGSSEIPLDIYNYTNIAGLQYYGTIYYDNKAYYCGYSMKPKLLVKKKQIDKVLKDVKILNGIRIY
jgi:hypothetical protein